MLMTFSGKSTIYLFVQKFSLHDVVCLVYVPGYYEEATFVVFSLVPLSRLSYVLLGHSVD
jgi:hypothetical protein